MDIAITKLSSKGQIVIPAGMRAGLNPGDKLVLIKNKDQFLMKKASKLGKNFAADLEFAKKTEQAIKRYVEGKFTEMSADKFLKDMKEW